MLKRGDVVQHKQYQWIGAVLYPDRFKDSAVVEWFEGRNERQINFNDDLALTDGYAFEAALALGDNARVLELYRAAQAALEPFAAYGKLKHPCADEAVFTIAYDRDGNAVKILFSDFTRAAELLPTASGRTSAPKTDGAVGGIAEIANDATVNAVLDDLDPTGQLKADWQALRGEES